MRANNGIEWGLVRYEANTEQENCAKNDLQSDAFRNELPEVPLSLNRPLPVWQR